MNRITIITLGVQDMAAARAFYEALGWLGADEKPDLIMFPAAGYCLCLYDREILAAELGCPPDHLGVGNMLLTVNWPDIETVALAFDHALTCGATAIRLPAQMPWGGYSGYWSDPDGNVWEYGYDPRLPLAGNGQLALAPPALNMV